MAVGIETLEEWVDRLNPEFLEPAMSTVVEELNLALWSHLRPQPYPFGPKVIRSLECSRQFVQLTCERYDNVEKLLEDFYIKK